MARPSIDTDRQTFLSALPSKETVGNISLRMQLNWRDERYWKVHSSLIEDGKIAKGRGRGGSVRRLGRFARSH